MSKSKEELSSMGREELVEYIISLQNSNFIADCLLSDKNALEADNKRLRDTLNMLGVQFIQ